LASRRLAAVERFDEGDPLRIAPDDRGRPLQDAPALGRQGPSPGPGERGLRRRHRRIDIGPGGCGHLGERLARRRIEGHERVTVLRVTPSAADIELQRKIVGDCEDFMALRLAQGLVRMDLRFLPIRRSLRWPGAFMLLSRMPGASRQVCAALALEPHHAVPANPMPQ
jgi:hypothetical protein